jgi:hypothetical protein
MSFFLIFLFVSLFLFIAVLVAGFLLTPTVTNPSDWTTNMWGCMNDWMTGGTIQGADSSWILFGVLLILSIGLLIVGVGGSVYFYLFPEISHSKINLQKPKFQTSKSSESSFKAVIKTMTEDERKVLELLKNHDGKYLQKYIRSEAGLSRLKTHRIIARFAERGIVTLRKVGNTNEVKLKDWL